MGRNMELVSKADRIMEEQEEARKQEVLKETKKKTVTKEKMDMITEDAALGEIASDKIFEDDPELAKELAEDRKIQEKAREYKELQESRKRLRRKRIFIAVLVIAFIATGATAGIKYYQKKQEEAASVNEVSISEGQELIYASITSIAGNNMTVERLEEASETGSNNLEDNIDKGEGKENQRGRGNRDENSEEISSDESSKSSKEKSNEKPQYASVGDSQAGDGKVQSGSEDSSNGSKAQIQGVVGGMQMGDTADNSTYTETGETTNLQIPVGTEVITKLGTTTTFSSLSTGDVIAIALEEGTDIIDKIWIVE